MNLRYDLEQQRNIDEHIQLRRTFKKPCIFHSGPGNAMMRNYLYNKNLISSYLY